MMGMATKLAATATRARTVGSMVGEGLVGWWGGGVELLLDHASCSGWWEETGFVACNGGKASSSPGRVEERKRKRCVCGRRAKVFAVDKPWDPRSPSRQRWEWTNQLD